MLKSSPKGTFSWMALMIVPTTAESSAQPKMIPFRPHALAMQLATVGFPPSIRSAAANTTATPKKVLRNIVMSSASAMEAMKLTWDEIPAIVSRPPRPPPMMTKVVNAEATESTGRAAMLVSWRNSASEAASSCLPLGFLLVAMESSCLASRRD